MLTFVLFVVVLLIVGTCAAGWLTIGMIVSGNKSKKKAETNAPAILDEAFNESPTVVFKINSKSPEYETVVLGAKDRGYRILTQTDTSQITKTLIFEKVQESASDL